jgi:hypothetical protein
MKVTVGGMDAAVEPSGMSSWRVTGMTVLNQYHLLPKVTLLTNFKNPRIAGIFNISKTTNTHSVTRIFHPMNHRKKVLG